LIVEFAESAEGTADTPAPLIRLRDVGLVYPGPPEVCALHPTDLDVERGDYVAIMGPSGSGKSTMLNVLGLLDRPTNGRYEFEGIDVSALTEAERTSLRGQRIGFVFQSFQLLPYRTTMENVEIGQLYTRVRRKQRRAEAEQALVSVGLSHRLQAMPTTLSGGERQRVAIARALVGAPSLLLCDEPTGNLDTATSAETLGLLDELHDSGVTIILITHDHAVAQRARRLVTIKDGRLEEERADQSGVHP
jgi:putative ABC transport system ATP-binding protein